MTDPDQVAANDQACAGMAELARMHAAYFKALCASGMSREEALELTAVYIGTLGQGQDDD